jgi:hypothetical protein
MLMPQFAALPGCSASDGEPAMLLGGNAGTAPLPHRHTRYSITQISAWGWLRQNVTVSLGGKHHQRQPMLREVLGG